MNNNINNSPLNNSKRIQLYYNKIKDHPDGYHGHYNREYKQLVSLEDLNNLNISEGSNNNNSYNNNKSNNIFLKYYSATKKLEHTLISNKDFVSINEDEDIPKIGLMDDIYRRVSHHGEDFKRCDFMFTPVVNSIMITCATEESGKRIKSTQIKSNPPEHVEAIPFSDLESEMKKLQQKRYEVKYFDRKNNRTNAIPSKATYELKHFLEKKQINDELLVNQINIKSPRPPSPLAENHSPTFKRTTSRPQSASILRKQSTSGSNKDSSSSISPRPRRPQTNQKSRYLSSTRKVQFSVNTTSHDDNTTNDNIKNNTSQNESNETFQNNTTTTTSNSNNSNNSNNGNNRKSPLRREDSSGIDESMLQGSDDSSDEGNEVFDTFNLKGVYLHRKRKALMGPSANNPDTNLEYGQHGTSAELTATNTNINSSTNTSSKSSSPFKIRSNLNYDGKSSTLQTPESTNTNTNTNTLTDKEKYRATIATQFLYNVLRKKSAITNQLPGEVKSPDPYPIQIQPEILSLFPKTSSPKRSTFVLEDLNALKSNKKKNKNISNVKNTKDKQKNDKDKSNMMDKKIDKNSISNENSHSEDDPEVWLEKRMAALLADYEAGEKRNEKLPLDEETRKIFDARTISIEISLLFRGFQGIDKSGDGFLSCKDIILYCNGSNSSNTKHLTKSEIKNVVWLMDDHMRGSLTFDDITRFYLRKRKEFLESSQDYKLRIPVGAEEQVKMRLHHEHDVLTECDMHSQPLLIFRILFFVAMQDSRGEVHLLTAFQNLSQLFGRAAEEQFNCIFLKNCLEIRDEDRQSLSEFIEYLKTFRVRIQRQKFVFREFNEKKAALVRFSYKKAKESLIGLRRNAVGEIIQDDNDINDNHN